MAELLDRVYPAEPGALCEVRAALKAACEQAGCDADSTGEMVLAVNEACMNIIQHGYAFAAGQQFRVRVLHDAGILRFQLLDNGRPSSLADLCPRALDELRPGGLGVHFIREMMDAVDYLPPPQGFTNLLQLSRRIA